MVPSQGIIVPTKTKDTSNSILTSTLKIICVLTLGCLPIKAQTTIPQALEKARTDLSAAKQSLEKTRSEIAAEKPSITTSFEKIELELREKRRLIRIARLTSQDRITELRQLNTDLATRNQDASYLAGLLKDHALKTTTLAIPGAPPIAIDPKIIAADNSDPNLALKQRLTILDASIDHLETILGGSTSPGQAASPSGEILQGTFAALGPVSYFLSSDKSVGGDVVSKEQGRSPSFASTPAEPIAALIAGNQSSVELDPTGGNARAMDEIDGGPIDLIRKGGLWVWPIMFLAILSLIFGLIKLIQFAKFRDPSDAWITAILAALRTGDHQKASTLALERNHPAGIVIGKLVSVSNNSADLVEETLYEQLMDVQGKATSLLPIIAVTAATSPLLGLLGTVSGMIATFNLITLFGSGDPKPLAGGISEALITTLFGLIVAIPALILHAFLSRRAQGIVQTTERLGLSFINGLRAK